MKAALYLRQSLDRDGRGVAVERQRQDCAALCEARGWEAVEYVDNSISASTGKSRPAYARMLADIETGEIQAVVCWDLDRLHRRPIELEHFIELADRCKLALATVTGDVDLGTDNGRLFARIKGSVARAEVERKGQRQRRAALQRAQDGLPWSAHRPFGFQDDKITHDPAEAEIVRGMYSDLIAGVSQHQIARDLNARGIKTGSGSEWVQPTVRLLLQNPRNAGIRAYKGEEVGKAVWEPIVSEETYRVARQRMSGKSLGGTRKHLLVGVAKCGVCGAGMITGYLPGKVRTYACTSGKHVARNAERVELQVTETILQVLESTPWPELVADKGAEKYSELSAEADTLRRRLDALAENFADGDLTASQLRTATARLQDRIEQTERAMVRRGSADVFAPLAKYGTGETGALRAGWERLSIPRRRSIIGTLANVVIMPAGNRRNPEPESIQVTPKEDFTE
ncbi:recombinase family protein [Arthrobacter rhombi]|uniref:recombinase family protein n=1 Tax=Arthrobacter rhombi TaxID=71253 RepID=UPI003FD0224E